MFNRKKIKELKELKKKGQSDKEIARKFNCSAAAIASARKDNGIAALPVDIFRCEILRKKFAIGAVYGIWTQKTLFDEHDLVEFECNKGHRRWLRRWSLPTEVKKMNYCSVCGGHQPYRSKERVIADKGARARAKALMSGPSKEEKLIAKQRNYPKLKPGIADADPRKSKAASGSISLISRPRKKVKEVMPQKYIDAGCSFLRNLRE